MKTLEVGSEPCGCRRGEHDPELIALTGGPGAGKTTVLDLAARLLCQHVAILPEAAGILFSGGFPRHNSIPGRTGIQRAIFHVQRGVERIVIEERRVAIALCDRGTPDGYAYWPRSTTDFWNDLGVERAAELERYAAVIHLQTPTAVQGYNQSNPLRTEGAGEALRVDELIRDAWDGHPRHFVVPSGPDFLSKARSALDIVREELPLCCRSHDFEPTHVDPAPSES